MKTIMSTVMANFFSFVKAFRVDRVLSIVLAGVLILAASLTTNVDVAQADQSLGERMRERVQQYDQSTERPKTTGEWLDEVEGDVPLGERVRNTVRDSAEAFKQFGKEYSVGTQESARNVQEKAAEAGENLSDRVQR